MHTRQEPGTSMPAPTPINQGRSIRRHVVSWVTAVAALIVITVLTTAVLVSHAGKSSVTGTQPNQPNQGSQAWTAVPGLTNIAAQPVLAPSNPQIIYLVTPHPKAALRRSDDGGAHWQNLTLPPQASQAEDAGIVINAGDAQNIFLFLTFALSSPACSTSQASTGLFNADSGNSCQIEYYSVDGGAHWDLTRWAAQTGRSGNALVDPQATQGTHLYSLIYDWQNQNQRLVMSADDGATWQFVDQPLLAQGQSICSFTAAPKDSSLFVLAQPGACSQGVGLRSSIAIPSQAQSELAIWRSDDAGSHWLRVSTFPFPSQQPATLSAIDAGGAQPVLFAGSGQGATYTVLMSTDGGKTWQPMPTQGVPAKDTAPFPVTVLSDGSFLSQDMEPTGGADQTMPTGGTMFFYAWKPGSQAWHQVAPSLPVFVSYPIIVSSSGGQDTLWEVTEARGTGTYSVLYYTIR